MVTFRLGMSAVLAAVLASAITASAVKAQDVPTIRLGHSQATEEPLWLMDTPGGVTPNRGKAYEAEFLPFKSSADRFRAYEAGALDCGTAGPISLILAASSGVKFTALASISQENPAEGAVSTFFVKDDSDIQTVAGLKGKRVAVNGYKSATELWLRFALREAGLNPDRDITISQLPFSQGGEAIRSGQIDSAMLVEPLISMETAKGGLRPLFRSVDALPFAQDIQTLYCNKDFIAAHPDAVKAFVADYVATLHSYLQDRPAAIKALVNASKMVLRGERSKLPPDYARDPDGKIAIENWKRIQQAMLDVGILEKPVDIDAIVDTSFLP